MNSTFWLEVMRSLQSPISLPQSRSVGILPLRASDPESDTSEPAWANRRILSINSSTSCLVTSRKYFSHCQQRASRVFWLLVVHLSGRRPAPPSSHPDFLLMTLDSQTHCKGCSRGCSPTLAKHRDTTVSLGNVVQFPDDHRLTHTSTTK